MEFVHLNAYVRSELFGYKLQAGNVNSLSYLVPFVLSVY